MKEILNFCLYYGNPLYLGLGLLILLTLWGWLRRSLRSEEVGGYSLAITAIISLISPTFVEWPMGSPIWQKESGIWVKHTQPFFHKPFGFNGIREWDLSWSAEERLTLHPAETAPLRILCSIVAEPDRSNMPVYCESVGEHWDEVNTPHDMATSDITRQTITKSILLKCLATHSPATDLLDDTKRDVLIAKALKEKGFILRQSAMVVAH